MPAGEHPGNGMAEAASSCEGSASAAVQIAALQALEALLTSGGALLPDRWRTEVDAVLASVAMAAATGTISASTFFEEDCSYLEALSGEFQVAAYQALLASLLSPCCHRPPFLAQGLSIFRNGKCMLGSPKFMLFALPPPVLLLCAESSLHQNQLGCASHSCSEVW
jgi:hypothetical protein